MTSLMTDLRVISAQLTGVVADLDPSLVRRTDVAELFGLFIGLERTAAAGRILLAQRLADTNQWKHDGYASAAEHQADLGGTSTGRAKADLLDAAETGSVKNLKDEAGRKTFCWGPRP